MKNRTVREQLSSSITGATTLFEDLPEAAIREILGRASRGQFPARSWLYRQGERPQNLYLVESGLVRLSQLTSEGEDILVRFMTPGEVLGYYSLATGGQNIVSAQVIQTGWLAMWDHTTAIQMLHDYPRAALNLFNIAARDAVHFYDRARRLQRQEAGRRVEWALSELLRSVGEQTQAGIAIGHGIGQKELAEMAGTTIFTVSRELTKLERQGVLTKRRGQILVIQPEKLRTQ